MFNKHKQRMSLFVLALLLGPPWMFAQGQGSLVGTVRDASGAVVPNAKVMATRVETGIAYESLTNESGDYVFPTLPVGNYVLSFEARGFQELKIEKIEIHVAEKVRQDATLQVGTTATQVEVVASTPMVKSESAEIGTLVGAQQVVELPLNGRNVYSLVTLTAGTESGRSKALNGDPRTMPAIAGGRAGYTVFRLDGVNINTQNLPSAGVIPILDSTQEFRVITEGAPAWFSDMSAVSVATKSGGNEIHGSVFEFLRNNVLDAHPFFQREIHTPAFNSTKAQLRYNQFGGVMGGPIIKNRTFFFGGLEFLRQRDVQQVTTIMPTTASLIGDFSGFNPVTRSNFSPIIDPKTVPGLFGTGTQFPGNIIPPDRFNPMGVKLTQLAFRPPNCDACLNAGLGFNYVADGRGYNQYDRYMGRIDHRFHERDNLFFSFYVQPSDFSSARDVGLPGVASHQPNRTQNYTLAWNHLFGPKVLNEVRASYFRFKSVWEQEDDAQGAFVFQNTPFATPSLYPMLGWSGYPGWPFLGNFYGSQIASQTIYTGENHWDFTDDVTWVRGNHQFRFGGEVLRDYFFVRQNIGAYLLNFSDALPSMWGYTGNAIADSLLGMAFFDATYQTATTVGRCELVERSRTALYLQDDWKVSSRLTLNLGLRWDWYQRWHDSNTKLNRLGTLDLSPESYAMGGRFLWAGTPNYYITGQGLIQGTGPALIRSQVIKPAFRNFQPRVGLAFRPFNDNKTAVRASYGIYYMDEWANAVSFTETNPPFMFPAFFVNYDPDVTHWDGRPYYTVDQLFPNNPNAGAGLAGMNPDNVDPRVQQWTFSIQHQLGNNVLFSLEYLGNFGTHNRFSRYVNAAPVPTGTDLADLLANPSLSNNWLEAHKPLRNVSRSFIWEDNVANSWYHGMNVKAEGRFKQLYFTAAYTWSKALDMVSQDNMQGEVSNNYDLRITKSYASFDHPHRFVTSAVYELPFGQRILVPGNSALKKLVGGWQVTGIATFEAGPPFSVMLGVDPSFSGTTSYPMMTGPAVYSDIRRSGGIYLTPANFAPSPWGTFNGAIARNFFHGPGINNFDLGFMKNTTLTEKLKAQFRAEMFNAFNHAQFSIGNQTLAYGMTPPGPGQTEPTINYYPASSFGRVTARGSRVVQFGLKLIW
jgi:hypothetical protein